MSDPSADTPPKARPETPAETPFETLFGDGSREPSANPVARAQQLSRADLPKRFYKTVSVLNEKGLYQLALDDRTVRTPGRQVLAVPSALVANTMAKEWAQQKTEINPATMPLTRLVNAALDGVSTNRAAVIDDIAKYAGSDLICYRAEDPERLVAQQTKMWDPALQRLEARLGARFVLAGGLMPVAQPQAALDLVRSALAPQSDLALSALHTLTALTGSILLTLDLQAGGLTFEAFWQAAHVDEDWNKALWGEDAEATHRREQRRVDAQAANLILAEQV